MVNEKMEPIYAVDLSYTEKGLIPQHTNRTRGQTYEGKSKNLASLNFIQHYDILKKDHSFTSIGPSAKGNETEPGKPLLPLRDIVIFPSMVVPLFVGREKSIKALNEVMKTNKKIILVTQKNSEIDDPKSKDLFQYGC